MIYKGRKKIKVNVLPTELQNPSVLANLLNTALVTHTQNKREIEYLINYKNGDQPILSKIKTVREEINNRNVFNYAQMITRSIIGYFMGNPINYIQSGGSVNKGNIDRLNLYVAYEDKHSADMEIADMQSICGTAFRIVYTDGIFGDEVPFETRSLDPRHTFVVYQNDVAEKPLVGVNYYRMFNENGESEGLRIYAYTDSGMYDIVTDEKEIVTEDSIFGFTPYSIGGVPIVEYPNNGWRLGDWELQLGLMEAINTLENGRLDDIEQIIQSLIVFINADIDQSTYSSAKEAGLILLKNTTNYKSEVQTISTPLDQSGMNLFAKELESMLYALAGVPSRDGKAGGGADTGQAVELRDGWADLEIIAKIKEAYFKRSEKQSLRLMINIMNAKENINMSLLDVDIKFSRNKSNNLLVKAQSYATLLATKTLSPEDCLTIVDLVSDVNEYMSRGKTFWGEHFAGISEIVNPQKMVEEPNNSENVENI